MIGFVARAASCWRVRSDRRGRLVPQLAYVGERRALERPGTQGRLSERKGVLGHTLGKGWLVIAAIIIITMMATIVRIIQALMGQGWRCLLARQSDGGENINKERARDPNWSGAIMAR